MTDADYYPNVFIIGAQKAGTTFLASCLNQHRDIVVSEPKEPHILINKDSRALERYKNCFPAADRKIRIDASTTNSFLCRAEDLLIPERPGLRADIPKRMKEISPHAKLVYILREPTERVASAARHKYMQRQPVPHSISLLKFMEEDPMSRLRSEYSFQIERYLAHFHIDDFLFLDYRHLVTDPLSCVNHVLRHIGVDRIVALDDAAAERNTSAAPTNVGAVLIGNLHRWPEKSRRIKAMVPPSIWKWMRDSILRSPVEIEFSDYGVAYDSFSLERRRTHEITGINFDEEPTSAAAS